VRRVFRRVLSGSGWERELLATNSPAPTRACGAPKGSSSRHGRLGPATQMHNREMCQELHADDRTTSPQPDNGGGSDQWSRAVAGASARRRRPQESPASRGRTAQQANRSKCSRGASSSAAAIWAQKRPTSARTRAGRRRILPEGRRGRSRPTAGQQY